MEGEDVRVGGRRDLIRQFVCLLQQLEGGNQPPCNQGATVRCVGDPLWYSLPAASGH